MFDRKRSEAELDQVLQDISVDMRLQKEQYWPTNSVFVSPEAEFARFSFDWEDHIPDPEVFLPIFARPLNIQQQQPFEDSID